MSDPDREQRQAEIAAHRERQQRLAAEHGMPEPIKAADALDKARAVRKARDRISPYVRADDIYASIYRDEAAADAWMEANRVHHGHPALTKVPLPDGRVIGILDMRPSLRRLCEQA